MKSILLGIGLSCLLQSTHAFFPSTIGVINKLSLSNNEARARRGGLFLSACPSDEQLAKVFGRLADKYIFLDESAGQCCHSGCDNCEWRYDFDVMRAARPKWLVTYQQRVFDADAHQAKWKALFEAKGAAAGASDEDIYADAGPTALTAQEFAQRLADLPFAAPLGPSGSVDSEPPSKETGIWLWERLVQVGKSGLLTARLMEKRLSEWANGGDSLMWGDFQRVLTAEPKVLENVL